MDLGNVSRFQPKEKKRTSERAELVGQFALRINAEREGTKYKKLSPRFIAVKLSHVSVPDLYHLLKQCEQSSAFSKVFFGSLKKRNADDF